MAIFPFEVWCITSCIENMNTGYFNFDKVWIYVTIEKLVELFSASWKIRDDIAPSGRLVLIYRPHNSLVIQRT
jgi:hypothetical protein